MLSKSSRKKLNKSILTKDLKELKLCDEDELKQFNIKLKCCKELSKEPNIIQFLILLKTLNGINPLINYSSHYIKESTKIIAMNTIKKIMILFQKMNIFFFYFKYYRIDEKIIQKLIPQLKYTFYPKNSIVYKEGEYSTKFYFLLKGKISFKKKILTSGKGHNPQFVEKFNLSDNTHFGEWDIVYERKKKTTAFCEEDCHIISIDRDIFKEYLEQRVNKVESEFKILIKKTLMKYMRIPETKIDRFIQNDIQTLYFRRGEIIFREGDTNSFLFIISSGEANLLQNFQKCEYSFMQNNQYSITNHGLGGVENLGAPINTPGNEEFPTFRPNGDLYFSSDGHEGLGGLDIYIAHPDTLREWVIEHPGYPLNSNGDDFGMTFEGVYNRGYFSSNRGDARGWDHIYSFSNPEIMQTVKGWVYEKDGYELTAAQVFMVGNDGTNLKLGVRGDGSFTQEVKPGVDYVLLATCNGYLNHAEQISVIDTEESEEHVLQFPLASITAPVLIDNIFYDYDRATLRPESKTSLDSLVLLLQENPNITIELSAHCDYKGSSEYNKRLSQRRAESVVNYLIEHGIQKDRLTPVGYGKEMPKTVRKKLTERFPYLKEGDVLTQEFIEQLKPEEQEPCNQLNRRTEFRVLRTTYGMATTPTD